jgi:uncharacterized protein (TIGR02266 family)
MIGSRQEQRMDQERRAHQRVPVEMHVEETHSTATYFQRSANLSLGGIFLESTLPHPPGTKIELKIELPDGGEPLVVQGEVVTPAGTDEIGMRVRFVDLDAKATVRIEKVLAALTGDEGKQSAGDAE